jgi:hypothetical protein
MPFSASFLRRIDNVSHYCALALAFASRCSCSHLTPYQQTPFRLRDGVQLNSPVSNFGRIRIQGTCLQLTSLVAKLSTTGLLHTFFLQCRLSCKDIETIRRTNIIKKELTKCSSERYAEVGKWGSGEVAERLVCAIRCNALT